MKVFRVMLLNIVEDCQVYVSVGCGLRRFKARVSEGGWVGIEDFIRGFS